MPLDLLLTAAHQHHIHLQLQDSDPSSEHYQADDAPELDLDPANPLPELELPELQHQLDHLSSLPFSFSHADEPHGRAEREQRMSGPNKRPDPARGSPFPTRPQPSPPSGAHYPPQAQPQTQPQPQAQAQSQTHSPLTAADAAYPVHPSPITDPFAHFPYTMPHPSPQQGFAPQHQPWHLQAQQPQQPQHQQHQQQQQHPAPFHQVQQPSTSGWPAGAGPGPSAAHQQHGTMPSDQFWAEMMRYQGGVSPPGSGGGLGPSHAGPSHGPTLPPITTTGLGSPIDPNIPASGSEDKRRRNTAASARFRIKKKQRMLNLERSVQDLQGRAEELEKETGELRRENGWLREMVLLKGGITAGSVAGAVQRGDVRAGLLGAFAGLGAPSGVVAGGQGKGRESVSERERGRARGKRRKKPEPSEEGEEEEVEESLDDTEEEEEEESSEEEEVSEEEARPKGKGRGKGKGRAAPAGKKKES